MQKPNNNKGKKTYKDSDKPSFSKPKTKPFSSSSKPKTVKTTKSNEDEIRLNKYISNSGVCSRREADIYIQSGNVKVNGEIITELGYKVKITDTVNFDGSLITPEKKVYILLNKPKNFTTANDEDIDKSVYELVKNATTSKIQAIGRMDKNTTGLLLFTNDNDLIVKFNASNQKSIKIYHVSLDRNLKYEDLEKIASGISLDEHRLYIEEIEYIENEPKRNKNETSQFTNKKEKDCS